MFQTLSNRSVGMSTHDQDFPRATVSQFLAALLACLIAPGIAIFLIIRLILAIQATHI
jgi:hypothetical protein